jgi:hypothetical protein
VMPDAPSDAKKAASAPTSSAVTPRPSGLFASAPARSSY